MIRADAVIVCDEIRQETTNKFILIGVYTGSVIALAFPLSIQLAFFVEMAVDRKGKITVEFRVKKRKAKKSVATVTAEIEISDPAVNLFVPLPKVGLKFTEECEMLLQMREASKRWQTIKRINVTKGKMTETGKIDSA